MLIVLIQISLRMQQSLHFSRLVVTEPQPRLTAHAPTYEPTGREGGQAQVGVEQVDPLEPRRSNADVGTDPRLLPASDLTNTAVGHVEGLRRVMGLEGHVLGRQNREPRGVQIGLSDAISVSGEVMATISPGRTMTRQRSIEYGYQRLELGFLALPRRVRQAGSQRPGLDLLEADDVRRLAHRRDGLSDRLEGPPGRACAPERVPEIPDVVGHDPQHRWSGYQD